MLQYDMSGFPVVDHGKLVGIVTEGDFLRRAETGTERHRTRWIEFLTGPGRLAEEYVHAHGRTVDEVMTREVVTVAEAASLNEAVQLMERHRVKRLPVVKGDAVVGIVTRANLLHAFIVGSPKTTAEPVTDAAIREKLAAELEKQPWRRAVLSMPSSRTGSSICKASSSTSGSVQLSVSPRKISLGSKRFATISSNSIGPRSSDKPRQSSLALPNLAAGTSSSGACWMTPLPC